MSVDWLVLTAANRTQARGYRAQLASREKAGRLPGVGRWLVVPDPKDRRVGSGGSTFAVLHELAKRLAAERGARLEPGLGSGLAGLFEGRRILVIHSGGDSRRLPAYAAQGKLFTPLPCEVDGREADLFDLVLADLMAVVPAQGRVVIATGDVVIGVAEHRPRLEGAGLVGVAFAAEVARGSRHGVYVRGEGGRVVDFVQKPDAARAAEIGAVDAQGRVLVDTGILSLSAEAAGRWLGVAGVALEDGRVAAGPGIVAEMARGWGGAIDLYHHILRAVPERVSREEYLREVVREDDAEAAVARQRFGELYDRMHGQEFAVETIAGSEFLHIGSTREMVELVGGAGKRWKASQGARVYGSVMGRVASRGAAVVEGCEGAAWTLRGGNLVAGVHGVAKIELGEGVGLVCVPVGTRDWAACAFGDRDDGKSGVEAGGTVLNEPLGAFLARAGVEPREVWRGAERTMWTARLWPVAASCAGAVKLAEWMWKGKPGTRGWRAARRVSYAEVLGLANHQRLIAGRERLRRISRLARVVERLAANPRLAAHAVATDAQGKQERESLARSLRAAAKGERSELTRARMLAAAGVVSGRGTPDEAFACVARVVAGKVDWPRRAPAAAILPDQVVWVTTPVRIDLHGGWSDTPPICHELGGRVVNAAITLNGQYPVQVMSRLSEERRIRLSSVDLGRSITLTNAAAARACDDPHDWAALPKAALVLSGVVPSRAGPSLASWLKGFGGGLDLTFFSALPKGSGLGTSSVLGAAILACLDRVMGLGVDGPSIIRRTSLLEQMMSTAGGWQDQAGGITPGIKLLSTEPGMEQVPRIEPAGEGALRGLAGRMLLYYTGQRRLARGILRNVVARYLERDAGALAIIDRLKAGASAMHADLARGDAGAFARGVLDYWECKKAIDAGATNAGIEAILRRVSGLLDGYELPGAGGGGFVFMIARDAEAAAEVRKRLTARPPNRLARFYDFAIDQRGLSVSVL